MKLKSILYLLIALPLLWSCNNEDNIEAVSYTHLTLPTNSRV